MDAALDKEVHKVDSAALATEPFVSITTFKRDGTPVSVPVWCAADNGILLVFSEADWKVKRIRRDAHVRLAPCSVRGKPRGPAVDADASLALLQLGNALAVRSERESVFRLGLGSNRFLGWTVLGTLLVQLGLLYWPPAQTALDLQPLTLGDLAIVLVASTAGFWAIEAESSSEGCAPHPRPSIGEPPSADASGAHHGHDQLPIRLGRLEHRLASPPRHRRVRGHRPGGLAATTTPSTSTADHRTQSGLV